MKDATPTIELTPDEALEQLRKFNEELGDRESSVFDPIRAAAEISAGIKTLKKQRDAAQDDADLARQMLEDERRYANGLYHDLQRAQRQLESWLVGIRDGEVVLYLHVDASDQRDAANMGLLKAHQKYGPGTYTIHSTRRA